ncbi:glycosyltransferase [Candidatus Pacearchaeota archaeon]|nr:glycosyltransferase [Candidatus Pacearchaeota archaeon]
MNFFTALYAVMFFFGLFLLLLFLLLHYKNKGKLNYYQIPKRYPSVSILIPAYNEEDSLENTVKALLALNYPSNKKEIIILNDGSRDGTKEIADRLSRKHKEVIVINKKNSGKADSLNQGIAIAKGELIAVVDADSYPEPDSLARMVGHFEDKKVGAVTSRVLVKNKSSILGRFQVMDYSIIAWTRKLLDFIDSVYVTNGPLSVYRTSVVKDIGGFDKKNLTEDIEITWHLLSKGYKTKMSYSAIVYTTVPESLNIWIKQRVRWNLGGLQTVNKYKSYILRNPGEMFGRFVIPYVTLSFAFAIIGFLLLIRLFFVKGVFHVLSLYYALYGYNYLKYLQFNFSLTFLLIIGVIFICFSFWYYNVGFKNSETGNKSVLKILLYVTVYRTLYIIPLIIALYKLIKGDLGWYTK